MAVVSQDRFHCNMDNTVMRRGLEGTYYDCWRVQTRTQSQLYQL